MEVLLLAVPCCPVTNGEEKHTQKDLGPIPKGKKTTFDVVYGQAGNAGRGGPKVP